MFNSRIAILGGVIVLLVVLNVVRMVWSDWGLVTLKYKDAPLQEVIDSLQKQAGIVVKTNLDPATPVTIRVIKKTFPEALEYLAGATDSNWELTYVMAPAKDDIAKFFDTLASGTRPEDWKWIGRGGGGGGGGGFGGMGGGLQDYIDEIPDPRTNAWNVQPVDTGELQLLLQQGNILTDAMFVVPATWNPKLASLPASGVVKKLAFNVASSASGQAEEVFLLMGDTRQAAGNNPDQGQGQRQGGGGFQFPQSSDQVNAWRDQRMKESLAKLPADKRAQAQSDIDQRKAFMDEMRKMTPEQRMAKMQEMMNDPAMQDKMEDQQSKRDSKNTPDQRLKRFKKMVDRKREIRNAK